MVRRLAAVGEGRRTSDRGTDRDKRQRVRETEDLIILAEKVVGSNIGISLETIVHLQGLSLWFFSPTQSF